MSLVRGAAACCAVSMSLVMVAGCGGTDTTPAPPGIPLISTSDLPPAQPGEVHLFGFNDLHGNLAPPQAGNGQVGQYTAGGAAYLAAHLKRLRAAYPDSAVVSAGDNIGASPLVSSLFHEEPTVTFLDRIGVAVSAVGNHELDHGVSALARLRGGGCAPDGCSPGEPFTGARFDFLAANLTDPQGGFPPGVRPWTMLTVGGHKIGVVGAITPDTVNLVFPEGIRGYTFGDEAQAINANVPAMTQAGAETVIALVHDGGAQHTPAESADYNGCAEIGPEVPALAAHTDPAVQVLFTAHSHQPYNCEFNGKVVTQAASFGRLITDVTLRFQEGKVSAHAVNRVVTRDIAPDPAATGLITYFSRQAAARAGRVVGTATAPLSRSDRSGGDSSLGALIADAMLDITHDSAQAVAAFMNPGGVRADIGPGPITYGSIYETQPFGNQVVTVTLTGRQILDLLEQQWDNNSKPAVLAVSGISYSYDDKGAAGHKVVDDSVRIGGTPLNPVAAYRVSTNNFLAAGGDGFSVFTHSTDTAVGPTDLDALETYLSDRGPVSPPVERVQRR